MSENSIRKFDSSNLDENQIKNLESFLIRRKKFDRYLLENKIDLFTCPGCGFPTLSERGVYEICEVCNWEDDNQDDPNADEVWGGPNYELSLTENRLLTEKELYNASEGRYDVNKENPGNVINTIYSPQESATEILNQIPDDANLDYSLFVKYRQMNRQLLYRLSRQ